MSGSNVTGTMDSDVFDDVTGSHTKRERGKSKVYLCGPYEITVLLTEDDRVLGVLEVGINRQFIAFRDAGSLHGLEDIEKYYPEDEED